MQLQELILCTWLPYFHRQIVQLSLRWYDFSIFFIKSSTDQMKEIKEKGGKTIPAQKKATTVLPKSRLKTIQIFYPFIKSSSSFVLALIFKRFDLGKWDWWHLTDNLK